MARGVKVRRMKDIEARATIKSKIEDAGEWDTSSWRAWMVAGRIVPERCDVNLGLHGARLASAEGRYEIRVQVIGSHISALFRSEDSQITPFPDGR